MSPAVETATNHNVANNAVDVYYNRSAADGQLKKKEKHAIRRILSEHSKSVIASQCRNTGVAIRVSMAGYTISLAQSTAARGRKRIATPLLPWQNADIGHGFAMTDRRLGAKKRGEAEKLHRVLF